MMPLLKSEMRKLLTIRSTYILTAISFALIALFAGFFEGYKGNTGSPASTLKPDAYHEIFINAAGLGITFIAIIAILFIAHEYRYNTIAYTLTSNVRRTKVLIAKLATMIGIGLVYSVVAAAFAIGCYLLGLTLRDASLPAQNFDLLPELGRLAFYSVGYILLSFLIATITRSVVVAIAASLIFPVMIEPLLGLLLKGNAKYLPYTSLDSVMGTSIMTNTLSSGKAMVVSGIYLAVALLVTWILFVRRDAN